MLTKEPYIPVDRFAPEEREQARHISLKLHELLFYISEFSAALKLYNFCQDCRDKIRADSDDRDAIAQGARDEFGSWQRIALRDAVFTIYHFQSALDSIVKGVRTSPSLMSHADLASLDKSQPLFAQYFPEAVTLRNAVGHTADRTKTPDKTKEHAFRGSYRSNAIWMDKSSVTITMQENRKFSMNFNGRLVSIELNQASLKHLREITETVFAALRPLEQI